MQFPRASGVLLHPTSLPGEFGVGDFGRSSYDFADCLLEAKQTYWQVLPLGSTGFGDSPYQCFSAFAGNTLLISPQKLLDEKLVNSEGLDSNSSFSNKKVNYGEVIKWKDALLKRVYEKFFTDKNTELAQQFDGFCKSSTMWLDDYALFRAIKESQEQKPWYQWERPLRLREENAMQRASDSLYKEIEAQKFYQFLFFKQWFDLKNYCNKNGIKIIGDVPIFVALDSADVWRNREQFKLNENGSPTVVAGVPPDYFSKTGQLWGNPIYNWERMQADGFGWWKSRIAANLQLFDVLRVDHFRGFSATWEVPGSDKTAENGSWVTVPGYELFSVLKHEFGDLPVFAEDLGDITQEVRELKNVFGFPGMKILVFAFGGDSNSQDLPHNYERNCVVYTGTHDNDTVLGWFKSQGKKKEGKVQPHKELQFCLDYLNSKGKEINWDFIRAALASVADTAIIPLQDLLGLDNKARMNLPATRSGNWQWRFNGGDLDKAFFEKLRHMTELYGRSLR